MILDTTNPPDTSTRAAFPYPEAACPNSARLQRLRNVAFRRSTRTPGRWRKRQAAARSPGGVVRTADWQAVALGASLSTISPDFPGSAR
jgi:hypothetical protein